MLTSGIIERKVSLMMPLNRIESALDLIGKRVLDAIYPSSLYCICCGNIIDSSRSYCLCDHCIKHIRWDLDQPFETKDLRMLSCVDYGIYERSIIFALKYDGHKYIADTIAEIMEDRLKSSGWLEIATQSIIIPVPLSKERLRGRGYNQSALIAKKLVERIGKSAISVGPRYMDALKRIKDTKPMKGLGPRERIKNISGSIEVKSEYRDLIVGEDILLIDDFFTTGSTGTECARTLRKAGAGNINMLAFAARRRNDLL